MISSDSVYSLADWGWRPALDEAWASLSTQALGLEPARIIAEFQGAYRLAGAGPAIDWADCWAEVTPELRTAAQTRADFPAVGDWVSVTRGATPADRLLIHAILPRFSKLSRKAAGEVFIEQILAANIDEVFLVTAADQRFSLRRIERFLAAVWSSGAQPALILSKADLSEDITALVAQANAVAPGVPVIATSLPDHRGLETVRTRLKPRHTHVLLGTSGAGKSSLVNYLAGADLQEIQQVRADDSRGRHTTTHRELFRLPQGALMIDTPGLRALQLWDSEGGVNTVFSDIAALAAACRFRDCAHDREPGCAVQAAIAAGTLDSGRLRNFHKLRREEDYAQAQHDAAAKREKRQRERTFYKLTKPPPWRGG